MIKNNELTEHTKFDQNTHYWKIILTQYGGYALGIKYQLTFENDSIILKSNAHKNLEGNYFGNNILHFKKIKNHLTEINFNKLKERYSITCADCPSREIEIMFDNGKRKKIYDYGEKGTLGLLKLYEEMEGIANKEIGHKLKWISNCK